MDEIDPVLRQPLDEDTIAMLGHLLQRRRDGNTAAPTIQELNDELGLVIATTRTAASELNERRLAVQEGTGLFATVQWPALASIQGKQVRMSLAQQLEDAGVEVTDAQQDSWAEADSQAAEISAPPEASSPADHVFPMIAAARSGLMARALAEARKVTAATITTAVVPLVARAAGWFARVLTAMGDEHSPATRHELPASGVPAAQAAYEDGFAAELSRHRDLAMQSYVKALTADPGFHRARLRYAWTMFVTDQADQALDELGRLIDSFPDLSAARLMRAAMVVELAARGDGDLVAVADKAAADLDPVDQDAHADRAWSRLLRSRALLMNGKVPVAIRAAQHAVALEPSRAEAYHALGLALTAGEDYLQAAWAQAAALLADHEFLTAGEELFNLRQIAQVQQAVPHARALIDHTWQ